MIVSVVEYYDADNDRFHVTVFFGAGREVSGRRRLVHDDVESFVICGIHFPARRLIQPAAHNLYRPDLVQVCEPRINGAASLLAPTSTRRSAGFYLATSKISHICLGLYLHLYIIISSS